MSQTILKLLAADNEDQAVEALTKYASFLTDIRALTGTDSAETALAAVKAQSGIVKQLETLTGKTGSEALTETQTRFEAGKTATADLGRVLTATGETSVDGALGSIATAKHARDDLLPKAQASLAEIEKAKEETEAASLLKTLQDESRITPSQEQELWPTLSLEGKRSFAKTAPPVSKAAPLQEEGGSSAAGGASFNGKAYADLRPAERAALSKENPTLFEQLRNEHNAKS